MIRCNCLRYSRSIDPLEDPIELHSSQADVRSVLITSDSMRVLYRIGEGPSPTGALIPARLVSRLIDGAGPARYVTPPYAYGGWLAGHEIAPDGARFVYALKMRSGDPYDLYSRDMDGHQEPVKMWSTRLPSPSRRRHRCWFW